MTYPLLPRDRLCCGGGRDVIEPPDARGRTGAPAEIPSQIGEALYPPQAPLAPRRQQKPHKSLPSWLVGPQVCIETRSLTAPAKVRRSSERRPSSSSAIRGARRCLVRGSMCSFL